MLQEGAAFGSCLALQLTTPMPQNRQPVEEVLDCISDSDLSEPDPPAFQVEGQKRVREMGGNAGGLWT